MEALNTGINY